jgi:hypothetical protein
MPHATTAETPFESLVLEHALAFAREMQATANNADDGNVLNQCELLALSKGRDLLRAILTAAAQQQAETLEKKGAPPGPVNAVRPAETKAVRHGPS